MGCGGGGAGGWIVVRMAGVHTKIFLILVAHSEWWGGTLPTTQPVTLKSLRGVVARSTSCVDDRPMLLAVAAPPARAVSAELKCAIISTSSLVQRVVVGVVYMVYMVWCTNVGVYGVYGVYGVSCSMLSCHVLLFKYYLGAESGEVLHEVLHPSSTPAQDGGLNGLRPRAAPDEQNGGHFLDLELLRHRLVLVHIDLG